MVTRKLIESYVSKNELHWREQLYSHTFHALGNCETSPSCTFLTKKSLKKYQGDPSHTSRSFSDITIEQEQE